MFKLKAHGRIAEIQYPNLAIHIAHHEVGFGEPVVLKCALPYHLRHAAADLEEGAPIWVEGNAYQTRNPDGRQQLRMNVSMLTRPQPSLTLGRGSMYATVHGRVSSEVKFGKVDAGTRAGCEYVQFSLHVSVPEMPKKHNVVLRVKGWDGESAWIAHNHDAGDRISLEGNLFELRFADSAGVARTAHQLVVTDWWWGKDRADREKVDAVVVSERVPTRPVTSAPVVIRRGLK